MGNRTISKPAEFILYGLFPKRKCSVNFICSGGSSSDSRHFAYSRQQIWSARGPGTRHSSELQLWQVQLWQKEARDSDVCVSLTLSLWDWTRLGLLWGAVKLHLPCCSSTTSKKTQNAQISMKAVITLFREFWMSGHCSAKPRLSSRFLFWK